MSASPEKSLLLKDCFQCLLLMNALGIPLRLLLFGVCPAETAAGLFPLVCLFLYLPLRCRQLHMDIINFFEYIEEE